MNPQQDEIDLREYVRDGSREALGRLARRHLNFVYGVARRETGDEHLAEDVTQAVFIVLAQRAAKIKPATLPGWLFITTRNVAANARKTESRRHFHERKAAELKSEHVMNPTQQAADVADIGHHLHAALSAVRESDRSIVIMRYVQGLEISQISSILGLKDEAARKRLERAMEKLRRFLAGRGVMIGSTAIAAAVASVAKAAPDQLASAVSGSSTSGAASMLAKTTAASMAFTQMKVAAMILIVLGIMSGIATIAWRALNRPVASLPAATALLALEEPAAPTPMVMHSGVVVDPDGKPLAGVRVGLIPLATDSARPKALDAETTTDAQGHYSFQAPPSTGTRTVLFDHPSFALTWQSDHASDPPPIDQRIQLEPPEDLKARVVDAAKRTPISGADIRLHLRHVDVGSDGSSGQYSFLDLPLLGETMKTDVDGSAVFKRLPPTARANVSIVHLDYARFPDGGANYGDDDYPARTSTMPFVAALKPGGQIRLRPAQADHPFPKTIQVQAIPRSSWPLPMLESSGTVEPDGSYIFAGLDPGRYDIVMNPGRADPAADGVWLRTDNVEVTAHHTSEASIAFGPGQLITGRLINSRTKEPLAGYSVSAESVFRQEPLAWATATSGRDGRFALRVLSGEYGVRIDAAGSNSSRPVSVGNASVALGDIEVTAFPVFRGRLVDATGKPIASGYVIAGQKRYATEPDGSFLIDSRTSRDMVINGVGSSRVIVGTPLFAFNTERVLSAASVVDEKMADPALRSSAAERLPSITLRALATVSAEVVDETGKGISDANLTISIRNSAWGDQYRNGTDPFGSSMPWGKIQRQGNKFTLEAPYGVSMRLLVNIGQARATTDINDVLPGEYRDLGQLVLQRVNNLPTTRPDDLSASIVGRILNDATGEPVGGATVRADPPDDQGLYRPSLDTTGHDGTFRLTELPPNQKILLTIQRGGYMSQSLQATTDGNEVTYRLHPAVIDLIGKPAPELTVAAWVNGEPMTLANLKGKVVLLDMGVEDWSAFIRSHRSVIMAAEKYSARGLVIIEIGRWLSDRTGGRAAGGNRVASVSQTLIANIKSQNIPLPVAIDSFGRIPVEQVRRNIGTLGQTALRYEVDRAPALILIDKKGIVRAAPDRDHLDGWIEKLLAE